MTTARARATAAALLILLAGCGQEVGPVTGADVDRAPSVPSSASSVTTPPTDASAPAPPSVAPSSGTAPSGVTPSAATPSGTTPSGTTPSGTAPSGTAPSGTAPSGTDSSGTAPSADEPGGSAGASPSPGAPGRPTPTAEPGLGAPLTAVPAEVMVLPPASRSGTVAWQSVGFDCDLGTPSAASAMRSDQEGDGAFERPVQVQQVVAFADVDAAVAEATRVAGAMRACAERPEHRTEAVPVGAQGVGLSYLYGPSVDTRESAFGSYVVLTRRGNALSLTGQVFGEGSPGSSRSTATDLARQGWAALCVYDRTGGC